MNKKEFYKLSPRAKHLMLNRYYNLYRNIDNLLDSCLSRSKLCKEYAWAIPTFFTLKEIAKYSPIIEIGAGKGYWAHLLREIFNVDIIATDAVPVKTGINTYFIGTKEFIDDIILPTKALIEWVAKDRALFLCWPEYDTNWAYKWTKMYLGYGGKTLIYIGERTGGCNADDKFFELIDERFNEIKVNVTVPQWDGIHDYFNIYKVKGV